MSLPAARQNGRHPASLSSHPGCAPATTQSASKRAARAAGLQGRQPAAHQPGQPGQPGPSRSRRPEVASSSQRLPGTPRPGSLREGGVAGTRFVLRSLCASRSGGARRCVGASC